MRRALGSALLIAAIAHSGCAEAPDLTKALAVDTLTTGWSDEGTVAGQHKIVPTATFALKNVSTRPLSFVQLNAVFRQIGNAGEWSSAFVPAAARNLAPGASTAAVIVKGEKGYTSGDPPLAMLQHTQFVDAKVEAYVKSGSATWIKLADAPIGRRLVAR